MPQSLNKYKNIVIIGSGAWGTALASVLSNNVETVFLYEQDIQIVESVNKTHINDKCFPSIVLNSNIIAINDLKLCVDIELIILAVPAQFVRLVVNNLKQYFGDAVVLICSKGIEIESLKILNQVCNELISNDIAILSGPNFANEIILQKPAATLIACIKQDIARKIAETFNNMYLRCYYTDDIIGVQVAGAAKNVIAIASGIIAGMNLGENAKAAIITRGLFEMNKLSVKLGGDDRTMLGLAGIGDLTLTCNSLNSRNMQFGVMISSGQDVESILKKGTFEGYYSALAIYKLTKKFDIDLPIFASIYKILYEKADIMNEYTKLMNRPIMHE